jgi:diguanylate cyclase (GGDEF)-like protein/PAS domain S-box-containing protein
MISWTDRAPVHAPPTRSPWGSVKLRLALIGALLIAASVALTVEQTLRVVNEHAQQVAVDLSMAHTRRMARLISARLVSLQLALRSGSQRLNGLREVDADTALALLRDRPVLATLFDTVFVSTPEGQVMAFRDEQGVRAPQLSIGDRDYFKRTVAQRGPLISQPVMGRASHEAVVMMTLPIEGEGGRITAVVGGSLRMASRDLMPEITASEEDDPAITVFVDAQGRIMSHPDHQWLLRNAAEEPTLAAAIAKWTAQGRPMEPSGLGGRFGEQLVTMAGVPGADWLVVRSASVASVFAGDIQARRHALVLGGFVGLAGGLLLLGATFFMLRPLRRLERCAAQLALGQAPAWADWPTANDEIGRLSRVLQQALHERAAADAAGRDLLDRLQAVMAHAPVGIGFTREHRFEAASAHFHRLLGYPVGELVGRASRGIYASGEFYDGMGVRVGAAFGAGQTFDEEIEFLRRDGSHFWGRLQGRPVRHDDATAGTIWTLEDVTVQRAQRETLAWASSHDALTQLANRAEFERRLAAQCQDRRRHEPVSALFIDLDRFKAVNDSAGHAAGDAVLVAVARVLEEQVRQADTVARLGGDEFAVLLHRCDRDGAAGVAEKMRAAVQALRVPWAGAALDVGASIGVVEIDASLPDVAAVMKAADAACYAAKHDGRNSVRIHGVAGLRLVGR